MTAVVGPETETEVHLARPSVEDCTSVTLSAAAIGSFIQNTLDRFWNHRGKTAVKQIATRG